MILNIKLDMQLIFFLKVLSNLSQWQHPVVILKDIKYEELSGLVLFL